MVESSPFEIQPDQEEEEEYYAEDTSEENKNNTSFEEFTHSKTSSEKTFQLKDLEAT